MTHADPGFSLETLVLKLKEEGDFFLIAGMPELRAELMEETVPVRLFTTITRQGMVGIWPCQLARPGEKWNSWHSSAYEAAERAMKGWIRAVPDRELGGYQVYEAPASLPDPNWPENSFKELLKIAFKDKIIDSLDHPEIQRLRGLA